jgi:aarF domain-containing kinase
MLSNHTDVHVPEVYAALTSPRVLTMEFCEGLPLTDVEGLRASGINLATAMRILTTIFSEQIFIWGVVHCDPHPGNVLVSMHQGRPRITLLDHGLYRELPDSFRKDYCRLWQALLEGNAEKIKTSATAMNSGELYPLFAAMLTYKPWEQVIGGSGHGRLELTGTATEKALIRGNVAKNFRQINTLLAVLPRDVLLLLKTNDCLHGLENKVRQALGNSPSTLPVGTTHTIMAETCIRALRDEAAEQHSSVWVWLHLTYLQAKVETLAWVVAVEPYWRWLVRWVPWGAS